MHSRIKELRKSLHLTQQKLADELGVSRSNIASYESGDNKISQAVITLICIKFNVNEHWLRTGEGEMFVQKNENDEVMEFFEKMKLDAGDSLKRRLVTALAQLDAEDWFYLEKVTQKLIDKRNKQNDDD